MNDFTNPLNNISRAPKLQKDHTLQAKSSEKKKPLEVEINQASNLKKRQSNSEEAEVEDKTDEKEIGYTQHKDTKKTKDKNYNHEEAKKFEEFLEAEKENDKKANNNFKKESTTEFNLKKMPLRPQDISKNKDLNIEFKEEKQTLQATTETPIKVNKKLDKPTPPRHSKQLKRKNIDPIAKLQSLSEVKTIHDIKPSPTPQGAKNSKDKGLTR